VTKVRMKALDTLHVSGVGPDSLRPGDEFVVSNTVAAELERRGLAQSLGEAPEPEETPQDKPPLAAIKKKGAK